MNTELRSLGKLPSVQRIISDDIVGGVAFREGSDDSFVSIVGKTTGEAMAETFDKDLKITKAYYGDPDGSIQKAQNVLFNLTKGGDTLHNRSLNLGIVSPGFQPYAQRLSMLSRFTRSAVPTSSLRSFGPALGSNAEQLNMEVEFIKNRLRPVKTHSEYLAADTFLRNRIATSSFVVKQIRQSAYNRIVGAIDSFIKPNGFKDSMHHALYRFLPQSEINASPIVAAKAFNHKTQIEQLSTILSIDVSLLDYMGEVGIKNKNNQKGAGALTALETISLLKTGGANADQLPKIGFLDPATIALVVKIGGIIVGVLTAAQAFVKTIKENPDIVAAGLNNQLGTLTNQARPDDFPPKDGENGNDGDKDDNELSTVIIGAGIIGAGIYYYS